MFESYNFQKITPEDIEKRTEAIISEQRDIYDGIGKISLESVSYDNVIKVRYKGNNIYKMMINFFFSFQG